MKQRWVYVVEFVTADLIPTITRYEFRDKAKDGITVYGKSTKTNVFGAIKYIRHSPTRAICYTVEEARKEAVDAAILNYSKLALAMVSLTKACNEVFYTIKQG